MDKKYIYLIIGLVIASLIAIALTIVALSKPINAMENPNKDTVVMTAMAPNASEVFYYDKVSTIKKWNLQTNQIENLIKFPFSNIDDISYSPDRNLAIVYWSNPQDSTYEHTWLVNLKDKKIVKELSQNIYNNAWSPDGQKIVYQLFNEKTNLYEIDLASADGTNSRKLFDFSYQQVVLLWPETKTLVYFAFPLDATPVAINTFDFTTAKTKTIMASVIPDAAMSLSGQNKFLINYLSSDQSSDDLNIYDLASGQTITVNKKNLYLNKAAVTIDGNAIFVAWRPDNQKSDDIIKINTANGKYETVRANLPDKINALNLSVSSDNKFLYFSSGDIFYKMKL